MAYKLQGYDKLQSYDKPQSYATHRRFLPLYHYFALPILAINVVVFAIRAFNNPLLWNWWLFIVSAALLAAALASRVMPLRAQDRVIRLEERTRLANILPADLRGRVNEFRPGQLTAMRFAPDDEVPELARRCLSGELRTANDIKRAIKNWRADHLRV